MRLYLLGFCCAFVVGGCDLPQAATARPDQPSIVCEKPVANMGIVPESDLISHVFEIKIREGCSAKITSIETSCGCTTVDTELVGKLLSAGSIHQLKASVRPDSSFEPQVQTIRVLTDSSATPLALAVRYQKLPNPKVDVEVLRILVKQGEIPTGTFSILHKRSPTKKPVPLRLADCRSSLFEIRASELKSSPQVINQYSEESIAVDRTTVSVRGRAPVNYGVQEDSISLVFADGSRQVLPCEVIVEHPFVLSSKYVFCGVVKPGGAISLDVPFTIRADSSIKPQVSVVFLDGEVSLGAEIWENREVRLRGTAPSNPGRFRGELRIAFAGANVSEVRVPFSGVVRE